MFGLFEKLLHPYPDTVIAPPPRGFVAFVWACTKGLRGYILAMTLLTAAIGAFEAVLFAMMGKIVDWLSHVEPALLLTQERGSLFLLAAVLVASP
ncbi:MAG: multidrug ABC transporter ATP-binding protein, partial [Glaciimonas sp.]|nr:multidrug ABC transporter ATP-binding protein [Glaciimonas sp.]